MASVEIWPRITTSELAGVCNESNGEPSNCPMGQFECPFNMKLCEEVTTTDWEEFLNNEEDLHG